MPDYESEIKTADKEYTNEAISEESLPVTSAWADVRRRFLKNRIAVAGLIVLTIIVISTLGAPLLTQYDPVLDMSLKDQLLPAGSPGHILGTDDYGRDIFSRLLYGGRISILTGLIVSLASALVGIAVGCISGYFGGWIDSLLMRLVDIVLAFPFLILAITLMAVLGPSLRNTMLALALVSWPGYARVVRGLVLSIKEKEYVEAARAAGLTNGRIIFAHVLPNAIAPIIVQATLGVGSAILSAASLNFLGLGVDVSVPEWGMMLNQGREYLQTASHLTLFPGLAISLTVLAVNWIGDGLRDALDPRLRQ
ncbi:MAG TPA: ABC transporter permease [Firmicutes bacterium]|nr:ABC transporter permease [Bacillota bacterium]